MAEISNAGYIPLNLLVSKGVKCYTRFSLTHKSAQCVGDLGITTQCVASVGWQAVD